MIDCWRERGWIEHVKPPLPLEVFRIPVELLKGETAIGFQSFNFNFGNYDPQLDKYWRFELDHFSMQTAVGQEQLNVWAQDFLIRRHFLWYSHTMHIFAKQEIDTRDCDLITYQ